MNDRRHCTECELAYSDEESHQRIHEATLAATQVTASPANGELPQPQA